MNDVEGLQVAYDQALKSYKEGGIPIGAALIDEDGKIIGVGHNERIQKSSAILHGEMSALENGGRLPGKAYKNATMFTTLSPCNMCTGACILYGVKRVVMGENDTFQGGEKYLVENGIEVVNLNDQRCKDIMKKFIEEKPQDWNEDIGV